ncbi:serine protease [Synechococcus sp. EJ6-Ellesmere]|uniref:S1 family peptidase n=1 Tax=Synechococcus sp. EJ6-Ellesmere TaxID=2823734 RepID=UPI0020CD61C3|nr:serine protease [Synechococcus sp. EJ6-Ellesmere]MCP9826494.1 trypsin-like peptidase domain-containing protein [Synechococcus sp. EJ6-Ellesmere]
MNIFTQLVYVVGRVTPDHVEMLGTGFLVSNDGQIATTHHVTGSEGANLVILSPHINSINSYQDLSDTSCQTIPVSVQEIDPIRDLAILKAEIKHTGSIPRLGSFDDDNVGEEVGIFGYPHCVEGRRALTFQRAEIGAKVLIDTKGIKSKHAVINTQARPGQSGSLVFSSKDQSISGVLVGAWAPGQGGISLGGINPRELHQTTQCVSAEYLRDML